MSAVARWYVARTKAQSERKALHHLLRQDFAAYLPSYLKRRRHARRTDWVPAPLFPRYLFVNFDAAAVRWRAISSTLGVDRLICADEFPLAVPEGVVEDIQARENDEGYVPLGRRLLFGAGDRVQVLSGALADLVGRFDCASDDERVYVLLDLLGRQVRVRVPTDALAPA